MKSMLVLPLLAAVVAAKSLRDGREAELLAERVAEVARINAIPNLTWTAAVSPRWAGQPLGASKSLLGVKASSKRLLQVQVALGEVELVTAEDLLGEDFEAPDAFGR